MLSPADQPPRAGALIDTDAVAADLARLRAEYAGREREMRTAVAQRLKAALAEGRARRRADAAEGPPRPHLRRAALRHAG